MNDEKLIFDRTCHVLYSKSCKGQIRDKIALHYSVEQREQVWTQVQKQYVEFLKDWRTDLGGKKNFHNGTIDHVYYSKYFISCKHRRLFWRFVSSSRRQISSKSTYLLQRQKQRARPESPPGFPYENTGIRFHMVNRRSNPYAMRSINP